MNPELKAILGHLRTAIALIRRWEQGNLPQNDLSLLTDTRLFYSAQDTPDERLGGRTMREFMDEMP